MKSMYELNQKEKLWGKCPSTKGNLRLLASSSYIPPPVYTPLYKARQRRPHPGPGKPLSVANADNRGRKHSIIQGPRIDSGWKRYTDKKKKKKDREKKGEKRYIDRKRVNTL